MSFCSCFFFFSPFSIAITSLGEERANHSAFRTFVRFVLVWICRFPLPLGVWEGLRFVIMALPGLFSYIVFSCFRSFFLILSVFLHPTVHLAVYHTFIFSNLHVYNYCKFYTHVLSIHKCMLSTFAVLFHFRVIRSCWNVRMILH